MFAMLTGSLPFTVEPFNIKALHNKMIIGQINPTPDNLTHECRDLLRKLLTPDPAKRITITDAMKHVWLSEGKSGFFERHPCPNKLRTDELDSNLLKHMCHNLGFRMNEIIRFCTGNVPSAANATYQLFLKKLRRYNADARVKGKIPAVDSRLMEPTKISLVFHDLPHRKTGMVPTGVKLLRRREPGNDIPDIIANSQRSPKITSPRVEKDITVTELDNDKNSSDDSQDTSVTLEGKKTPIQIPTAVYTSEDYTPVRRSVFKTTNIQRVLCANPTWLRKTCQKEKKTMSDELSNINKLLSPQKSTTETEIISNVSGKSSVYVRLGKHLNPTRQAQKSRNSRTDKTGSSSETPVITTVVNRSNSNNISVDLKPMNKRPVQINYLAANKMDSRQSKIDNLRRPVSIAKKSASKNEAVKKSRTVESVKDERLELNTCLVTDRLSDISNSRDSILQNPKGDPDVVLPAISPVFSRNH
ncbi:serine/threonine-protein kinase BRSK2-like [Patella vulgata]|uniref:serine/threonine-protein kinase BRSK2-like n=1 Tax=Patella vulgata TaxID=6465 RepID=UPI0024A9D008|nr:serine/threonine-protein kinase BRSK2-like [Patella vulgata]